MERVGQIYSDWIGRDRIGMEKTSSIAGFSDPMSSISHLAGAAIFFLLSFFLLASAWHSRTVFWYVVQFVLATLFLLTMSFVYHMLGHGWIARDVLLRLDVAAIFVLIASTFTVIHGILFQDWRRWKIILLLWTITTIGVSVRSVFFHSIPSLVGDSIFLAMGWIGAYSVYLIGTEYGWRAVTPIIVGGLFYSVGAVVNSLGWPVFVQRVWGPHETFHLFVLAGLGTHWAFVWGLANGTFQRRLSLPK